MKSIKLLFLVVAIVVGSLQNNMLAGDASVAKLISPRLVDFAQQENEVEFLLQNPEAFAVTNLFIFVQIYNLASNQLVYESEFNIDELPAETEMKVSAPKHWHQKDAGNYQVQIGLESLVDIDPRNNFFIQDVNLVPPPLHQFFQVNMMAPLPDPFSSFGIFSVEFPPLEDPLFVNAVAKQKEGTDTIWLIKNMPLLPFPDPQMIDYWFDISQLQLPISNPQLSFFDVHVRFDEEILPDGFKPDSLHQRDVAQKDYDVDADNDVDTIANPPTDAEDVTFNDTTKLDTLYRGCRMPNVDLNRETGTATEDYAGDKNACGPAAAANSLQWLEETHDDIPETGTDLREKMKELSKFMEREQEAGVTTQQLIKGKLAFIDEHKLPIHVKYQSWFVPDGTINSPYPGSSHKAENKQDGSGRKPPAWEFLKSEMEKGEDVEIMFGWYDKEAKRHGGHWVTVTGVKTDGKARGIYFKDDAEQGKDGGTRQTFIHWKTHPSGWSRLVGFDGPNNYCWVESVVSESYDPSITHVPVSLKGNESPQFGVTNMSVITRTNEPFTFTVQNEFKHSLNIHIVGISGRVLYQQILGSDSGNTVTLPAGILNSKGIYLLNVSNGETSLSYKFFRQ